MKRKDLALIIAVIIVSAIFSTVVSKAFFTFHKGKGLTAKKVETITADFPQKDSDEYKANYSTIFNAQAIDPTQLITIGNTSNPKPF
jgi:hypothetical protein